MRTAIPANREKVWTAGIEDSAPTGRGKPVTHPEDHRSLWVCPHAHMPFPLDPHYTDPF